MEEKQNDSETVRIELEMVEEMMTVLKHFTYSTVHERNRRNGNLISIKYHFLDKGMEVPLALWTTHYSCTRDWVIKTMADALKQGA